MRFLLRRSVLLLLSVVVGVAATLPLQPEGASAQGGGEFLLEGVCRERPHSEDCICKEVRRFGRFPREFNPGGTAKDADGDGYAPELTDEGLWLEDAREGDNVDASTSEEQQNLDRSDLVFMLDDRYSQRCALSYFRENQRRLWVFAVALGVGLAVLSLIWTGLTFMQHSASGMDLSKARMHLARVIVGVVLLACAAIVWEGLNEVLFSGVEFWTFDRSVFYEDMRR